MAAHGALTQEFNQHQRQSFCVYSGRGVHELRRFLQRVYTDDALALQYGALHPEIEHAFMAGLARQAVAATTTALQLTGASLRGAGGISTPGGTIERANFRNFARDVL